MKEALQIEQTRFLSIVFLCTGFKIEYLLHGSLYCLKIVIDNSNAYNMCSFIFSLSIE